MKAFEMTAETTLDPLATSHTAPKFAAPDPASLAEWYADNLGFETAVFADGAYAIAARGELCIHFWKCEARQIAENTACYTEIETLPALEMLHEEILKASKNPGFKPGRVETEPKNQDGHGMREFHMWDPAGNLIGFGAPLGD